MSPELHEGDSYKNPAGMSELQLRIAADVWAWGLVVWEVTFIIYLLKLCMLNNHR